MNRKPEIEGPLRQKIDDLLVQSGEHFRNGDLTRSLETALQAWDLIPEPKAQWDYFPQSLSAGFVQDYTDLGDVEATKRWIKAVYEMYDDPDRESLYTLKIEGEALYKLGLMDEAYDVFARVFEFYDRDGFKGEHLQYLEFYLKERARRDG